MDRIILHKTSFAEYQYDEKNRTMYSNWFIETEHMKPKDFEYEMTRWAEVSKEVNPSLIYDFCCNFIYTIDPEQQIWMAHVLNPAWIEAGVQKYAHIVPEEFIANLSVEQMFEEFFNMNLENQFEIRHFAEEAQEEAKAWLFTT